MKKYIGLFLFYSICRHLPHSTIPVIGPLSEYFRLLVCKMIFKKCGRKVNIGQGARFSKGFNIEIDDYSGIGMNCQVPENIKIGKYVMMGHNVIVFGANHNFDRVDIPMIKQGIRTYKPVIIEDDVWIGSNAIIMAGRIIRKGSIIGAGSVVTRDFPEYSIIAGNPAKIIRSRIG